MTAAPVWLSLRLPLGLRPGEESARPGERVCPGARVIDRAPWECGRPIGHKGRCVAFGVARAWAAWLPGGEA